MHNITIETERLILRPLTASDAEAVFEWAGDERVTKYMNYLTYENTDQVREWLKSLENDDSSYLFGFVRRSDGKLIGSGDIGFDRKSSGEAWGFGYNIRFDCWGQGYTTEAVKAMMNYVHENFGAENFTSSHAEPNIRSGRVMEKCGLHFVKYGELKKLDGSCKMRSMIYEGKYTNK